MKRTFIIEEEHLHELVKLIVQKIKKETPEAEEEYVSKKRAMEILGVKSSTLQSLRNAQSISFTRVGSRSFKYHLQSLYDYMESKRVKRL